jgi:membrane protease YdiL (CAAX protease family)
VSSERLTSSEKRALLLWVLVAIAGAVFASKYFFRAFPEASVDFRVSRNEALRRAQDFVSSLGENVGGYRSVIVFDVDEDAKTYLERELGLSEANQLMAAQLKIWYWDVRFFRPQQEEEFHVRVTPAGSIAGYSHKIEEARPGAALDRGAAQNIAQNFLVSRLGEDPNAWEFLPEERTQRPNRVDWAFTWERRGLRAKDAPYRLRVILQGDRPGEALQYLQVPEAWQRSYQRLRSGNDTLTLVFVVPYLLLLGIAVWLAIRLTRLGQTTWQVAIGLGAVVAALLFLQNVNNWPLWSASYDTTSSWGSFLFTKLGLALVGAIATAITITLVLPAAEPLYRAAQPDRLQLYRVLSPRGLRSKEFFCAAVVGLSMAAAHIGYVVAFYIVASRFGAWAPQEVNYEESINTLFPWISGAAIGLLAATNEEFTFRLFAIPFFRRVTRWRWIAVVLPAFLWSFLHSNYPQEPPYIRGVEIGLFGMLAGLVMLRWGILATLIWHYTVDALLVGLFLIRSNSLYFKASGIVVAAAAAAPLALAVISYIVRGRFEPDQDLLNRAAPLPELTLTSPASAATRPISARRYEALAPGTIGFLVLCLVAGGALAWRLKPESIGDYLRLSFNPRSARARADEIFRQRGQDPRTYYKAAMLVNTTDGITNEFLRQRVGIARTNGIYASEVPGALWRVRYFRDSQPEEFAVVLKPDGSLHSVHHTLAEAAPGASLTNEEAVARGEKFLREEKKTDLRQWTLVESKSDKRPRRTDHKLTWQQNAPLDATQASGHAYARIELVVLGDEVTNYRTYVKIPDEWRRKQEEQTLFRAVVGIGLRFLFLASLGIGTLVLFFKNIRSEAARSIPWKRLLLWTLWGLAGYLLVFALGNRLPSLLSAYDTAIPFKLMIGTLIVGVLLGALFYSGTLVTLFGIAWYYGKRAFGEEQLPDWTAMPAAYYRDALWIGVGGAGAVLGLGALLETASRYWPTVHRATEASFGSDFDAILPAGSIFGAMLLHSLLVTGLLALLAGFIAAELRWRWLRFLSFTLGALAIMPTNWGTPQDFAKQWLAQAIFLAVLVFGIRRIMRFNLLGAFSVAACLKLVTAIAELAVQPDPFYRSNGYAMILLLMALLAGPLSLWRLRMTPDSARAGASP